MNHCIEGGKRLVAKQTPSAAYDIAAVGPAPQRREAG